MYYDRTILTSFCVECSIVFKGQTFTFDHVFGSDLTQGDLYERTAASMLKSFLDGYNCTIIAYGQTGSGKTYTMGTGDIHQSETSSLGLVPRFVNDLFQNLNYPEEQNDSTMTYKIKASFLEIYGEDVYDLLASSSSHLNMARNGMPVREDENGKVFVQGQIEQEVHDPESAFEVLATGSANRITASTAMNAGSSRSHAVFTLTLEQYVKSSEDETVQAMTSKLTFVDLAGSERIKRTGAEGQRMKEGIQINSGLFNLGQVINALADEQKLKKGTAQKAAYVPYRNSKLTHLLKDALGGNSQTLFLACISPAESNESETHSTLSYARQARNIQNKPVKNMDETQAELRRLRMSAKTWMLQAVKLMFSAPPSSSSNGSNNIPTEGALMSPSKGVFSPGAATLLSQMSHQKGSSDDTESLLQRPEVIAFIDSVNASIKERVHGLSPSPRKVRLSLGAPIVKSSHRQSVLLSPSFQSPSRRLNNNNNPHSHYRRVDTPQTGAPSWMPSESDAREGPVRGGRESILFSMDLSSALEAAGHNVDDSERLIERMMDVINEEKRIILGQQQQSRDTTSGQTKEDSSDRESFALDDEDAGTVLTSASLVSASATQLLADSDDDNAVEELKVVDKLIAEKEDILNKLLENIKGYSALKHDFERLVDAINSLEQEKKDLESELERAKKSNPGGVQLEKIRERFTTVQAELRKMKDDRKSKEQAYKLMQKETKQCDTMQKELQKLKESKVALMKQQKAQFQEMQRLKKEQVQKLTLFKKQDVKKQQLLNSLKSEVAKKERILGHRDKEIGRMAMKLKACEDHITQLLKIQNRARNNNSNSAMNAAGKGGANSSAASNRGAGQQAVKTVQLGSSTLSLDALEAEHLATSKAVLDQAILSQVERRVTRLLYEKKAAALKALNLTLVQEVAQLEALMKDRALLIEEIQNAAQGGGDCEEEVAPEKTVLMESLDQHIKLSECKIEQYSRDIDICNADIDDLSLQLERLQSSSAGVDNSKEGLEGVWSLIGQEIVLGLSSTQAHSLLFDIIAEKAALSQAMRCLAQGSRSGARQGC